MLLISHPHVVISMLVFQADSFSSSLPLTLSEPYRIFVKVLCISHLEISVNFLSLMNNLWEAEHKKSLGLLKVHAFWLFHSRDLLSFALMSLLKLNGDLDLLPAYFLYSLPCWHILWYWDFLHNSIKQGWYKLSYMYLSFLLNYLGEF